MWDLYGLGFPELRCPCLVVPVIMRSMKVYVGVPILLETTRSRFHTHHHIWIVSPQEDLTSLES